MGRTIKIPVGVGDGSPVGFYTGTGVIDFEADAQYCIDHGLPIAEEVNNPEQFSFITETDETDYKVHCEYYLANCLNFTCDKDTECRSSVDDPLSLWERFVDKIKRRRRSKHPIFCGEEIDTVVLTYD